MASHVLPEEMYGDGNPTEAGPVQYVAHVALLTGGNDKHYAVALASALVRTGVTVDFVASTDLDCPEVHVPGITFLNLRGDQREGVPYFRKVMRVLKYYGELVRYAAVCKPKVFHILWNNKFELVDRILLMIYYRILGKRVVFTAHNVNAAKRDSRDNWLNRTSLRIQYRLCSVIFAHTELMKRQLIDEFGVDEKRVVIIPYGINVTIPTAGLTQDHARARLGLHPDDRVLLFFGQIAPYKGMEYLIEALRIASKDDARIRLVIAGKVKLGWGHYWAEMRRAITAGGIRERILEHVRFVPDEEIEQYFVAADALVLPYTYIFQSGVLFLAYSFGLPVLATDVGSLRDYVSEGRTGFVCQPGNADELATTIKQYFSSRLYQDLDSSKEWIRRFANQRHSWNTVATITGAAYTTLAQEGD
jgi:D-inositol-3-phosphate glycosyltransferase